MNKIGKYVPLLIYSELGTNFIRQGHITVLNICGTIHKGIVQSLRELFSLRLDNKNRCTYACYTIYQETFTNSLVYNYPFP